jgi:hypothetical protein
MEQSNIDILNSLSIPEYNDDASEEPCTICLENLIDKNDIRAGRHCNHKFHLTCLKIWMGNPSKELICPLCRRPF